MSKRKNTVFIKLRISILSIVFICDKNSYNNGVKPIKLSKILTLPRMTNHLRGAGRFKKRWKSEQQVVF